jgi:sulfate permease, SulP family
LACLVAWLFRLSVLVKLITDSVLIGFKAGVGLTIALNQLPALLGVPERPLILAGQLGTTILATLAVGHVALVLLWCDERWAPDRARRGRVVDRHRGAVWAYSVRWREDYRRPR